MPNAARGEVAFGETGLSLRYTINAICELEGEAKQKFGTMINALEGGAVDFAMMRALVWAGLRKAQPDLTVQAAGDLIDEVGLQKAMEAVGEAVRLAFPTADGDAAKH